MANTAEASDILTANIGYPTETDIVATLNITTGLLELHGTGETKEITPGSWGSGGLFNDGGEANQYVKEAVIGEGITAINGLCNSLYNLAKVTLPGTLKTIYGDTFYSCGSLTEITIPESVTTIATRAFIYCDNTSVTILNKDCDIGNNQNTLDVKSIKGHAGSTAQVYALNYNVPFEMMEVIVSIEVATPPIKTEYFVLEKSVDTNGMEVSGTTDDGQIVNILDFGVLEVDFSSPGQKTVTVTFQDLTAQFYVTVKNPTFEEITNTTDGMTEDSWEEAAPWFMFDGAAANKIKCLRGYVYFNDSTSYSIRIVGGSNAYVTNNQHYSQETILDNGIRVLKFRERFDTSSVSDRYVIHETFFLSNGDICINLIRAPYWSNTGDDAETKGTLTSNSKTYNMGLKSQQPAQRSFYHQDAQGLNWEMKKEAYSFPKEVSHITIDPLPEKLEYSVGETFDATGMNVNIVYVDGTSEVTEDYTVSDVDTSNIGVKAVTVTHKTFTASFEIYVYGKMTGLRIARYPSKKYYRIGEELDTSGMEVKAIMEGGMEKLITTYTTSGFDSSKVGTNTVVVSVTDESDPDAFVVFQDEFAVIITEDGANPFEDNKNPIYVTIHWINGEFNDLANEDIASGSVTLQESICSDRYFIWGGCICNQLTFTTHSKQFMGTGESAYPHGDIEAYAECNGTKVKIFTGTIDSGDREGSLTRRKIIAYDYLYKFRNTDIAWWYKNNTTDKQMILTQKQFRDQLFTYLGIEQVEAVLQYDNALVPNTQNSNEMNAVNIIKDMCLQNSVFGWMNRDGKFEYRTVKPNCRLSGTDLSGNQNFEYFDTNVHFDTYKSCTFREGRIWTPREFFTDPYPGVFSPGGLTAQEAYESNAYYNRNSFFVGNDDWLDRAFLADEYGVYTVMDPVFPICFGITNKLDDQKMYRAQQYSLVTRGNPLNMVGDTIEIAVKKTAEDGTELQWFINSYIMSRTLRISGGALIEDTYSANNSPYNGNNQKIGKDTPELSATLFRTRQEAPMISYEDFSDGTSALSDSGSVKKDKLRCIKRISKVNYDALVAAGKTRTDTAYFVYEV